MASATSSTHGWGGPCDDNVWKYTSLEVLVEKGRSDVKFDLLLAGGTVIDPGLGLQRKLDVGVTEGRIAALEPELPRTATQVVELDEELVTPGLIDLHTHVYWGATPVGVTPDRVSRAHAVTTLVDAGSAGAGNILGFKEHVVKRAKARIFAFLNISFPGIVGAIYDPHNFVVVGENEDVRYDMVAPAIEACLAFPRLIKGVKVRTSLEASGKQSLEPLLLALEVGEAVGKPVMVHIGTPPPTRKQVLRLLRKGDVLTHAFRGYPNAPIDRRGNIMPEMWEARERGVIIDLGHGGGSFSWRVAEQMLDQGFLPDVISSDIHLPLQFHKDWPGMPEFDLPTTMSKMLSLGMELLDVIRATTYTPAQVIGEADTLGTLRPGSVADISVLQQEEGKFTFKDWFDGEMVGTKRLVPRFVVLGGKLFSCEAETEREES